MKSRASLPGADELFRVTSIDGNKGSRAQGPKRSTSEAANADAASGERVPSGRQRHEEKITFYCTAEELMDLEHARLVLRRQHQIVVDRGRLVREALAQVLSELDRDGADAALVKRLLSQ
jgi:capsid protein